MKENCAECKFKECAFSDLSKISDDMTKVEDKFYVKCLKGNTETIVDFYKRNWKTPSDQVSEQMPCFEKTKFAEETENLIDMANDILKKLKESK